MGPEVAAAAGMGSLAFSGASSLLDGIGGKQSQDWLAARDARKAQLGRIKANQTDAHLREELTNTLANIDVVRSAANADPTSPTAIAIKDNEARISDRARRITVGNIRAQADEDAHAAMFRRELGRTALLGGFLGAGGKVLKGMPGMGSG